MAIRLFLASALDCQAVAVLLFCQCGSDCVDVSSWNERRAQLRCATCGQATWLDGFTISEFDPGKAFSKKPCLARSEINPRCSKLD